MENQATQTCTKCGETKPLSAFDKKIDRRYGKEKLYYHKGCRACRHLRDKLHKAEALPPPPPPRTEKACKECGVIKPLSEFYSFIPKDRKARQYHPQCKLCRRAWHKVFYADFLRRLRAELRAAYGGRCACCGETTPEFLSVDHIYGGGRADRRIYGGGTQWYSWLRKQGFPKDKYQLLCHNCNFAKGMYGKCPHLKNMPPA